MSPGGVAELTRHEGGIELVATRERPRRSGSLRMWALLWAGALAWSLGSWLAEDGPVANPSGWPLFGEFWSAALTPELSVGFLGRTAVAALTTLAFAVLGTLLAVAIGLLVGVLMSDTWWGDAGAGTRGRAGRRAGWLGSRVALALPRGVHEAVWALLLISVLGRDPLVGVLAIAIPFGAITAKVYAEIIDESAQGPYRALRASGTRRLPALLYGVLPIALPDLVSYGFYRFECSVRSAVILGMVGAGGLGFELALSFAGLRYAEMWTLLYALIVVSALVDRWGAMLRHTRRGAHSIASFAVAGMLVIASLIHLGPDMSRVFSVRTWELLAGLVADLVPPRLPDGGWPRIIAESIETLQMSLVAGTIAGVAAVAIAFIAARQGGSPARRAVSLVARWLLLLTRALPPPVWALLALFVLLPGPLPGAVALGIYNFGILGRLCAEVVENLDRRPHDQLVAVGASPSSAFLYGIIPVANPRFVAYGLYRWEVAIRETVIVGVVGAGGLGRLLESQRVAFDFDSMAGTVLALIVLSFIVDMISTVVRRSMR